MALLETLTSYLDARAVRYERIKHPTAYTAQTLAHAEHVSGWNHAKVVMLKAGDENLMGVLPANCRVDFQKLGAVLNKPVRLATEAEFKGLFPDCQTGAMPPFGHFYGIRVLADSSLAANDFIVFQAGTHEDAIKMSYADFQRLEQPRVARFAVLPEKTRAA
jgi:Ala-tRNA(Pro) deacylase